MTKNTEAPKSRDYHKRPMPDAVLMAYRARVDETVRALATLKDGPHWVRHNRYDSPTFTAIVHGHWLNVWQADQYDWRVTLDVDGIELAIAQVHTAAEGRTAAASWAQTHDAKKVRLIRKLHMGFRTWGLDETAFPVAAARSDVLELA